jgi:exosortase
MTHNHHPAGITRTNILRVALLMAASVVLWWRPLADVARLALSDEAYTHILLIAPLVCALLYVERTLPGLERSGSVGTGLACLGISLLMAGFARWGLPGLAENIRLFVSVFALVLWWIGSFILCFGASAFRARLFPLCLLFWVVPVPAVALDEIVYFLQQQSALAARLMFKAVGEPVTQNGIILSLPSVDIEVARECSSIRSSLLLVIITMILAHLFLRSWWRKALLIAAAIPLAAIKNGFRIFTITELATRVDMGYFDGNLHHRGGILFLAVALALTIALLWGLRRGETLN